MPSLAEADRQRAWGIAAFVFVAGALPGGGDTQDDPSLAGEFLVATPRDVGDPRFARP